MTDNTMTKRKGTNDTR